MLPRMDVTGMGLRVRFAAQNMQRRQSKRKSGTDEGAGTASGWETLRHELGGFADVTGARAELLDLGVHVIE